ncbi:MAG: hypothetical protein ACU0BS_00665 [Hasllibacter sp.]
MTALDLASALAALRTAEEAHDKAVGAFSDAERRHGVGSAEAAPFSAAVDTANVALARAEREVLAVPAMSLADFARKAAALLTDAPLAETAEHLRHEAEALARSAPPVPAQPSPPDPVAIAGLRWARIRVAYEAACAAAPDSTPSMRELQADLLRAEREMLAQTATSPEGVAALADLAWWHNAPVMRAGSAEWSAEWNNPACRSLRALRDGAGALVRAEPPGDTVH